VIQGEELEERHVLLEPRLIVRESSGPARSGQVPLSEAERR
jgi:hypothetical protein